MPVGRSPTKSTAFRGANDPPKMAGLGVVRGRAHRQDASDTFTMERTFFRRRPDFNGHASPLRAIGMVVGARHASPGVIHANAVDVWINRAGQDIRGRRVRRPYGTHLRGGESRISGSDQQGSNHQGHDRHDVDQDVHTWAGGVFERIANRVADNCRGMSIGALAA